MDATSETVEGRTAMTKEEAIKHLHTYSSTNGSGLTTQDQHEEAKMIAIKALETQPGWIPCTPETMPKNKSNVLTVIYIPGRQAHIRSGWYEDGLFMNDNGDTWKATDKEVVGWMYQPKLPKPYREGGQDEAEQ